MATISIQTAQTENEPFKLPNQSQDTTDYNSLIQSQMDNVGSLNQKVSEYEQSVNADEQAIRNLRNTLGLETKERTDLENQNNIKQQQQEILNASNQLNVLASQAKAIPIKYENLTGGERTTGGVLPLQESELRRNAIQALTIGADLAAKQGNLSLAQQNIDSIINAKYKSIESDLLARKEAYEMNKKSLERYDKKRSDSLAYLIKKQEEKFAEQKKNDYEIQTMIIEATPNAPANVVANARKLAESGASKLAVAQALGVYGGDYLKNELLREQLKTERAQRDKIYSDINKNKTPLVTGKDGIIATLPKAQQDRYYKLQGDFDKATEKYRGAIDAAGSLSALAENATAQDQTAIIFQYMKTLDPTSTVREGEFALVASTAGLGDRAINAIKKLDNGQRLNEQQINEIVGAANKLAGDARKNISGTEKEYDRRASIGGLPSGLFKSEAQQVDETEDYATNVLNKLNQTFNQTPKTFLQSLTGQLQTLTEQ